VKIARVLGSVVSTLKHEVFRGTKLLLVQPLGLDLQPSGEVVLAVDTVSAGVGETVLLCQEGHSARQAAGIEFGPVCAVILGIVDRIDLEQTARG